MPVIFGCTLILILLIRYETQKHSTRRRESIKDFMLREMEANTTRKKDISNLPYLNADVSRLPEKTADKKAEMTDPDGEITAIYETLRALDGKQLLNLSDISNTDLKLAYGAANFPFLSECDTNFTIFTRNLQKLASLYAAADDSAAAIQVLEYALELHTDIGASYRLLGHLYADRKDTAALMHLTEAAASLPELTRTPVLQELEKLNIRHLSVNHNA